MLGGDGQRIEVLGCKDQGQCFSGLVSTYSADPDGQNRSCIGAAENAGIMDKTTDRIRPTHSHLLMGGSDVVDTESGNLHKEAHSYASNHCYTSSCQEA